MKQEQVSLTPKEISQLFNLYTKRYHEGNYNCAHFVRDCYKILFGLDTEELLSGFMLPPKDRKPNHEKFREHLTLLKEPETPCIAITGDPHVGLYLNGRVLHCTSNGVFYDEPETLGKNIRYYRCQ